MLKHVQTRSKAAFSDDSSLGMDDDLSSSEEHICKRPPLHDDSSESNMSDSPIPTRTGSAGCNISNPRDSIFSHFLPDQLDLEEKWLYTLAPRASYDDDTLSSSSDETRRVKTSSQMNRFAVNRNASLDDSTEGSELSVGSGGASQKSLNNIEKYGNVYRTDTNNNKEETGTKKDSSVKKREKIRYIEGEISTESPKSDHKTENIPSSIDTTSPKEQGKNENKKGNKFLNKLKGKNEKKTNESKTVMNVIKESPLENQKITKTKKSKDETNTPSPKEKSKLAKYTDKLKSSSFRASPLTKKKCEERIEKNKKENENYDRDKNERKSDVSGEKMTPRTEKKHKSLLSSFKKSHEKLDNDLNSLSPSTRPKSLILGRKFPHSLFGGSKENLSSKNTDKFKSAENLNSKKSLFSFKTFRSKSVEKIDSPRHVRSSCSRESVKDSQSKVRLDSSQNLSDVIIPESPLEIDDEIKINVFFESSENVSESVCPLQRSQSFGPSTSSKNNKYKLYPPNITKNDSSSDVTQNDVIKDENLLSPNRPVTKKVIVKCRRSKSFNNASDHRMKRYDCDIFHEKILPTTSTNSLDVPSLNDVSKSCDNVKLRCIFYRDDESPKSGSSVQRSKSFGGRTNNKNINKHSNQLNSLLSQFKSNSPKTLHEEPYTNSKPIPILIHRPSDENLKCRIRDPTENNSASTTLNPTTKTSDDKKHNLENHEQVLNMTLNVNVDLDDSSDIKNNENKNATSSYDLLHSVEWNALQLKNNERLLLTNEQRLSIISELLEKIDENTNLEDNKSDEGLFQSHEGQLQPQVYKERNENSDLCSTMKEASCSKDCILNTNSGNTTEAHTPPLTGGNTKDNINGQYRPYKMNANDLLAKLNMEILRSISYIQYKPSDKKGKNNNRGDLGNESKIETDFVPFGCTNRIGVPVSSTNRKRASSLKSTNNEEMLEKELQIIEELFQNIDTNELLTELNLEDPNINLPKSALLSLKDKITYSSGIQSKTSSKSEESCSKQLPTDGDIKTVDTSITEEECYENEVNTYESAYDDPLLDKEETTERNNSKLEVVEEVCEAVHENRYCSGITTNEEEYLDNLLDDCVDSASFKEENTKLNKKETIPCTIPIEEDICVSIDTSEVQSEPNNIDNWYDEIFSIPDEEFELTKKIENPIIKIDNLEESDNNKKNIMSSDEDLHSSGIEDEEIEEEDEEEENLKDTTMVSNESANEINKTNESISSDSGLESNSLDNEMLNDSNVTDPNSQSLSLDYEDEVAHLDEEPLTGQEGRKPLVSKPSSGSPVSKNEDCKSEISTSNIAAFNIEDIDSGTELQYDDLFSPTDPRDNDSDYNTWLTSIKPLLCDCDVVANLFSRLANKYCEYKDAGKKAYYMQQVHMATTAYDVITDNNLTNFSSVISIMLSFVGAIKSEKPPPSNISVPNILVFLEQLVEKGSLSSFHITLFTVLLSRPNEKLKKFHTLRVNLLHTCLLQELRHLKITSNNELKRQLCVTFIKISEYFVHFDIKLASRLVDEYIITKLTPRNDVEFIDSILGYMGLGKDKNENILATNDVSSSLVLLNIIYEKTKLSSISTQKLYTVLKSDDNPKFRFCDQERDALLKTLTDLENPDYGATEV